MSLNPIKGSFELPTTVGTAGAQAICKASLPLPEDKPDIGRLLPGKAVARIDAEGVRVEDGRVLVKGSVSVLAPYVAVYEAEGYVGDREPLRFLSCADGAFEAEIPLAEAKVGMTVDVDAEVDSFELEASGPREVALTAIVRLGAKAVSSAVVEVVSDIPDPEGRIEVARKNLFTEAVIGAAASRFTIRDAFQIPEGRPDIGELLDYTANVVLGPEGLKAGANRITANGTLDLRIAYAGDLEERPIVFLAGPQIDFSTVVDLPGANEACGTKGHGILESLALNKVGSRTLQVEAVLRVDAEAATIKELSAVVDVASKGDGVVDYQKGTLVMESLVGSLTAPAAVAETFAVAAGKPSIDEIIMTTANARVNDARITPDKVTVTGEADVFVTYVGTAEEEGVIAPIESAQVLGLPFTVNLDVPGVEAGMSLAVACDVIEAEGLKAGPRAIDVDIRFSASVKVTETVQMEVVSDAALVTASEAGGVPSRRITVYVVQPGDTMWKIARRYGKTMAKIAEANELTGRDPEPGQKLLIPA